MIRTAAHHRSLDQQNSHGTPLLVFVLPPPSRFGGGGARRRAGVLPLAGGGLAAGSGGAHLPTDRVHARRRLRTIFGARGGGGRHAAGRGIARPAGPLATASARGPRVAFPLPRFANVLHIRFSERTVTGLPGQAGLEPLTTRVVTCRTRKHGSSKLRNDEHGTNCAEHGRIARGRGRANRDPDIGIGGAELEARSFRVSHRPSAR